MDFAGDAIFDGADGGDIVPRCLLRSSVDGDEGEHGDKQAGHDEFLASDAIAESAEYGKERRADEKPDGHEDVGGARVHAQDVLPVEERVELAGVGDNALAGERAKERDEHLFEVGPLREGLRRGSNLETEGPVLRWPSYGKRPQEVRHARAADHAPRRRQGHDERLQLRAPYQQGLPRRR